MNTKFKSIENKFSYYFASLGFGIFLLSSSCFADAESVKANVRALTPGQAATYAYAIQLFDEKRYSAAFGRFMRLADAGHAPSAQIALDMLINGPDLYNGHWTATRGQLKLWRQLIARNTNSDLAKRLSQTGD
jgi:hypothetical protein